MKKIYSSLALLFAAVVCFGQSQRLVLFEEFTQASCPPCAATNPGLNALLNTNSQKIVSVKYQTDWPGYDPMNVHNPAQVQTRVNYYAVSGVPDGEMDGNVFNNHPAYLTQAIINSRYAVPSPFTINVSHTLSANNDSIYCHATITCTQAVSGTLVAHMAIIERDIYFTTPPGSNGEKHFEGVMKRMLPSDAGTALPTSFTVGQVQDIDYSWHLANVYNINELSLVAWVQDNSNKAVLQTGYSAPHIDNDAGITAVNVGVGCSLNINPEVNLHNFAPSNPLTQVTINYKIDAGTVQNYIWTGNLAAGGDVLVTLPAVTSPSTGNHTLTIYTSMPNNLTDAQLGNDQFAKTIVILNAAIPAPITEDFVLTTYPPSGWFRENVDGDAYQWARSSYGNLGALTGSSYMNLWYAGIGTVDNLYAPAFDYSAAVAGATLEFDLAHAGYSANYVDRLQVNISTDCGATWTTPYNKADPSLITHTPFYVNAAWTAPSAAADWRHEVIDMTPYIGQSTVIAQFKMISGNGNNLFIDNINIKTTPVGINSPLSNASLTVYPNPSSGMVNLDAHFESAQNVKVAVYNIVGEIVTQFEISKTLGGLFPIDLSKVAEGAYTVKISTDAESMVKSINIVK